MVDLRHGVTMTAPSNANTSGLAPTDALRLVPTDEMIRVGAWRAKLHREANPGDTWEETAREVFTAMLSPAPAAPLPGGGWQDISTAPRNGEEFQAWWKGTWQPRARFDPEYGSFQLWGRTDYDTEGWETFEIDGYWQPQPAAPTGEPK